MERGTGDAARFLGCAIDGVEKETGWFDEHKRKRPTPPPKWSGPISARDSDHLCIRSLADDARTTEQLSAGDVANEIPRICLGAKNGSISFRYGRLCTQCLSTVRMWPGWDI